MERKLTALRMCILHSQVRLSMACAEGLISAVGHTGPEEESEHSGSVCCAEGGYCWWIAHCNWSYSPALLF